MEQKEPLYLQTVIVKKPIGLLEAFNMAQKFIRNRKKKYVVEKEDSYHFRNLPARNFKKDSFRSKVVDDKITLVFGHLKDVRSS